MQEFELQVKEAAQKILKWTYGRKKGKTKNTKEAPWISKETRQGIRERKKLE